MDQHLVDDDLEEQRRDEREELQEERGDQHLAELLAVFVDRAQKPGDVEPARQIRQARRAASSGRGGRPRPPRTRPWSSIPGAASSGDCTRTLSSPTLPRSRKPPSRSAAMAGSGVVARRSQLILTLARLEAELLGAAQHFRDADRAPRRSDAGSARDRRRRRGSAAASPGRKAPDPAPGLSFPRSCRPIGSVKQARRAPAILSRAHGKELFAAPARLAHAYAYQRPKGFPPL